jgi:hypothetical protein
MFKVSLRLRAKQNTKGTCRVCREIAELRTERLCSDCVRVKAQIRARIPRHLPKYGAPVEDASTGEQRCTRSGCKCGACDERTLGPHPIQPFNLARDSKRETHFHPRCHELWRETASAGAILEISA